MVTSTFFEKESYETLSFLGEDILVPERNRVEYYSEMMQLIQKSRDTLYARLNRQIDEVKIENKNDVVYILFYFGNKNLSYQENCQFVNELRELMYDEINCILTEAEVSINLDRISAMDRLTEAKKYLVQESIKINSDYYNSIYSGQDRAYREAASSISGMKFGIITNSTVDALAYSAMSYATLKKQAKKADEQYQRAVSKIYDSEDALKKKRALSLMYEQYVPFAEKCIDLWVQEILNEIISYEEKRGNKIFKVLLNQSIEKSQNILSEIDNAQSEELKREILKDAFKECVYNENVYIKIAQSGYMSAEINSYAMHACGTMFLGVIEEEIIKICKERYLDFEFVKKALSYRLGLGADPNTKKKKDAEVLIDVYKEKVQFIQKEYGKIEYILRGQQSPKNWLCNTLNISLENFIKMANDEISSVLKKYIYNIVSKELWDFLMYYSFINIEKIALGEFSDYEKLNEIYLREISSHIIDYREIVKEAYNKYEMQMKEYTGIDEKLKEELQTLEKEISELGVFSFKKKKELKQKLEDKQTEYNEFQSNTKMPTLNI